MKRESITPKLRFKVLERDNFTCQYCGAKSPDVKLEIDHKIPVAKGGTNDFDNLITACFHCNRGKGVDILDANEENKRYENEIIAKKIKTLVEEVKRPLDKLLDPHIVISDWEDEVISFKENAEIFFYDLLKEYPFEEILKVIPSIWYFGGEYDEELGLLFLSNIPKGLKYLLKANGNPEIYAKRYLIGIIIKELNTSSKIAYVLMNQLEKFYKKIEKNTENSGNMFTYDFSLLKHIILSAKNSQELSDCIKRADDLSNKIENCSFAEYLIIESFNNSRYEILYDLINNQIFKTVYVDVYEKKWHTNIKEII